jgi:hypothetical protein
MCAVLLDRTDKAGNRQGAREEQVARHRSAQYAKCVCCLTKAGISLAALGIELACRAILVSGLSVQTSSQLTTILATTQ